MSEGVEAQLRIDAKALKEVLRQEIQYFRASGEFDDLAANRKKLQEIDELVDNFVEDNVLALLAGRRRQLQDLYEKAIAEPSDEMDKLNNLMNLFEKQILGVVADEEP